MANGADLEGQGVQGATPLIYATRYGHVDVLKTLVELNANI